MGSPSPYAAAHLDPQGAGDARPTTLQIIKDEGAGGKLAGKVIVITGATSGIGLETARALKATGSTLFLTARNRSKAEKNLAGILEPGRVNVLTNGAGLMGIQNRTLTEDNIEAQLSGNCMGFFLLFQLLKEALLASVTPELNSQVAVVASSAHRADTLPSSDNYNFEKSEYNHETAYNNAKLAAVYSANTLDRLYDSQGLHATSLHPGAINTDISRNMPPKFLEAIMTNPYILKILKSLQQGAATTVWAAVGKEWEAMGGKCLEDCKKADRGEEDGQTFGPRWVKQTYNPEEEDRLWKDSLKIVGLE
ncbi:hypothetical protein PENCOP_c001G08576 [Penicillium coprophilum]|uniref:Uncharacterized protein n=1 Tax=Penicillium coprophilum TaxID=36646 RepID=A0A1V6V7Z1_9EURO|nr:hypothetical protein PENCOP_c001G08576 [Penicillium coprophilum]